MLTKAQEKLIRSLHRKKGRLQSGKCLLEGEKFIADAGDAVDFTFTPEDTELYYSLTTTETPQDISAVANIPQWKLEDVMNRSQVLVLDGIQDPGNVGTMLRSALGFDAGLILVESADPTSSKVIRSSAGAMFQVPWISVKRDEAEHVIEEIGRDVIRLEKRPDSVPLKTVGGHNTIIVGSEGAGIQLPTHGQSVVIQHEESLESLNAAIAATIILHHLY